MTLTLVVPTRDDHGSLHHLLAQAAHQPRIEAAIVVDDASERPHDAVELSRAFGRPVTLVRQAQRAGAGAARNRGLEHVTTEHMLFFDADDRLGPELAPLLDELDEAAQFDFCLFRHADSNVPNLGRMPADEALWATAGTGAVRARPIVLPPAACATLVQTSNYPWNKIYRTAFLRECGLRCSETLVHNDITLHWGSFASAQRVLVSGRLGAIHQVSRRGQRLTNVTGRTRLAAFVALESLARRFCAIWTPLTLPFLRWSAAFFDWMRGKLDTSLHPRLECRMRHFVISHVSLVLFECICRADPVLALRLCAIAAGKRARACT